MNGFRELKKIFKQVIFYVLNIISKLILVEKNVNLNNINIIILFKKPLGLGDLVMLSPFVKILENKLIGNIYILSDYEQFIEFNKVKYIKPINIDSKLLSNSLVISPTLAFTNIKYMFKAKFFLGYFISNKLISNISNIDYKYNPKNEHYLEQTFVMLDILNIDYDKYNFDYPLMITYKYKLPFNTEYITIAPYSNWKERQYKQDKYLALIKDILNLYKQHHIILIGSSAKEELSFNETIELSLNNRRLLNLTGKTTLTEMNYLIKNSKLFIGNDSGPANIAYILAQYTIVFFGSIDYENRLPINSQLRNKILPLDNRNSCKYFSCYDGYNKPSCFNTNKYSCLDTSLDSIMLKKILG